MALVLANRVQESGTPNTTVSFTLTGAVLGFQTFSVIGNGNTTYYSATDTVGNWEVGLGTYSTTGPTLTRTTVYASSNSGLAVTFPGAVNVFVTYPSGKSVNLDDNGNVGALGTVSSGTWQGSTVGVAYGGTGVTASSGANSVMLRDSNQNVAINRLNQSNTNTTATGGTTALTAASSYSHTLVGTGNQTFTLPDATTLTTGVAFLFNNRATGTVTIQDYAAATIGTITAGGAGAVFLTDNSTVGGTWDVHGYLPEGVTWGTNALNLGTTVISNGTWQGGTIQPGYGGTGLTTFVGANNALYSTGAATLTAGTLPPAAGGTGVTTTPTNGQLLIGNGTNYTVATLGSGTGISTSTGAGTLTINNTGVTSLAGTSPVNASASTGSVTVSLASGYGDTQNPYTSKTANYFLAAPNGTAGAPTFRAVVAADIPTLNQNTTGSAGSVVNAVTFNNGGTGDASGTTFDGSAARTISYNTIGAPSTTGTNATGTWGISITGNAGNVTGTVAVANGGTGLTSFTANRLFYASSTSVMAQSANAQFNGATLTLTYDAFISGLRVGRGGGSFTTNTAVGANALQGNTSGEYNTAIGNLACYNSEGIFYNTAVGNASQSNMIGAFNTSVGYNSLVGSGTLFNNYGYNNVAIGAFSLNATSSAFFNTAVGHEALTSFTSGSRAVAVGYQAALGSTTAVSSVAVGAEALRQNSTGSYNTALGAGALYNNTTQNNQTATGYQAMYYMRGGDNTAVGSQSMLGSTTPANNTGSANTALGTISLYSVTSGARNTALGRGAFYALTSGSDSVAVGWNAGAQTTTGYGNTALGYNSFNGNTTGSSNVAVGFDALTNNTTQSNQTAVGYQAMLYMRGGNNTATGYRAMNGSTTAGNNTGTSNSAVGYQALYSLTSGNNNTAIGTGALYNNTSGGLNTAVGSEAGFNATSGSFNVMVGGNAHYGVTSGSRNVSVGYEATYYGGGNDRVSIGYQAGYNYPGYTLSTIVAIGPEAHKHWFSGGSNVAIGYRALYSSSTSYYQSGSGNTVVGNLAAGNGFLIRSGGSNTFLGAQAGFNYSSGSSNVGVGVNALYSSTSGGNNTCAGVSTFYSGTTGSANTCMGFEALYKGTTGDHNTALGRGAGYSTAAAVTTNGITTGSENIYVGGFAYPSGAAVTREIVIGYDSTGKGANTGFINANGGGVYQGNNSTTWSTTSDARIKQNFNPVTNGLEVINALDPFEFDYILTGKHDVGFKAQQYMTVLPEQVQKHAASDAEKELVGEDEIYGIQRNLDPYLVSAIKSLTEQVKALQQEIAQLKGA